jgi:hypothetical protein
VTTREVMANTPLGELPYWLAMIAALAAVAFLGPPPRPRPPSGRWTITWARAASGGLVAAPTTGTPP